MEKREIAEFIAALREGREPPWDQFFEQFDPLIRSVVAWGKWHLDAHTREDVAQSIRQEIVRSIGQIKEAATVEYFVKKICIHRIIDEIRRQVRAGRFTVAMQTVNADGDIVNVPTTSGPGDDPVMQIVLFERAAAVRQMLEEIGEPCSSAIRSFYFEGTLYKEIASSAGISINTVGTRLSKCLEKLRSLMKSHVFFREETDSGFDSSQ
ncbi:MAG: sigma-70 family RNA polymerase sigma factor [bacterium]